MLLWTYYGHIGGGKFEIWDLTSGQSWNSNSKFELKSIKIPEASRLDQFTEKVSVKMSRA